MKTLAAIFLCALAALVTLATFAVKGWMAPVYPLFFGGAFIALPTILAMFALEPATRRPPWTLAGLTVVAGIVAGLVIPALWLSSDVRLMAVQRSTLQQALVLALDDPNPMVQVGACQRLFDMGAAPATITSELTLRPSLAIQCLDADSLAARSIAARIVSEWQDRLSHDSVDSCEIAEATTALQGVDLVGKAVGFMECALTASQPTSQTCCLNQLQALKSKENIQHWIEASGPEILRRNLTATTLLVSHREPNTLKSQNPGIGAVGLDAPNVQYLTLSQACEAVVSGAGAGSVRSAVEWVFGQHETCLTEDDRQADLDSVDACRLIIAGTFQDLERQICSANQYSRQAELAKRQAAAERAANSDFGALAGAISSGSSKQAGKASLNSFIEAAKDGGGGLANFSAADLAKIKAEVKATTGGVPTKDTIDKAMKKNSSHLEKLKNDPRAKQFFEAKTPADIAKLKAAAKK